MTSLQAILSQHPPVQTSVLDGLGHMIGLERGAAFDIGYGPCNL